MKKRAIIFLMLVSLMAGAHAQVLNVATYNMRYENAGDAPNLWQYRLPVIAGMVQFFELDIFGGQELLNNQVEGLAAQLPDYSYVGVGRDDGDKKGEYSPVFFRKDKFKLLKSGTFWLSETPDKVGVKGWDAALPRICSWVQLEEKKTGFKFFFFNTHFDHKGIEARKESAKLILDMINKLAGNTPAVLTGDFNVDQLNESYTLLATSGKLKDSYEIAKTKMANNGTFNNFNINSVTDSRIDHIFVTSQFQVSRYGILTESYDGKFPSDHFPVMVTISKK